MKLQQCILTGFLVAIGATTFFGEPAKAQVVGRVCEEDTSLTLNEVCGPFQALKRVVNPSPSVTLQTSVTARLETLYDHNPTTRPRSSRSYAVNSFTPVPVLAATYFQFADSLADPLNINTDNVVVTNIWARDLLPFSPMIPDASLTGFDPNNPEIIPLADEVFIGKSGTLYPADVTATVTIANLANFLGNDAYDLDAFAQVDPNSIVYVSQVTIPGSDLVCTPEHSSLLGLLTFGILGSSLTYKRKLQGKSIKLEEKEAGKV